MKKRFTRALAALLVAMMLIPMLATFAVSAEGETDEAIDISDIVNVYELNKLNAAPPNGTGAKKDDEPIDEEGMVASEPFAVTRTGDRYLYVGPCPDPRINNGRALDYIVYWYKSTGAYTATKRFMELGSGDTTGGYPNIVGEFPDGSVILKIRINQTTYKYAAFKLPTTYSNFILATCERPFTVEEYYAYADAQGWSLEGTGLRPAQPEIAEDAPEGYEGIWNYFSLDEDYVAPTTQKEAENVYVNSKYIPVTEGDVITFGAVSTKETQNVLYTYSDERVAGTNTEGPVTFGYAEVRKYKRSDYGIDFVENIGNNYAIYSFTVPAGVSFVKVSMPESTYANGDVLVTKNQAFNGAQFREALEVPELSEEAKAHPFYGKNALFVGDSILAGEYDTPTSYSNPTASFARRLALATGLIPAVNAAAGATIGQTGKTNVKCAYDLLKIALMSKKNYDMIIFQGGINDARQGLDVGTVLPVDTERDVLAEKDRTNTFVGNLQLMFYDARNKWADAEFYFIAGYKVTADVTDKDLSEYYDQAKELCKLYGVHYIDLYNDAELYETFDYTNNELFADDNFTPISVTYNLLFPTVLRLFNKALEEEDTPIIPDTPEETTPEETTPEESVPEESTPEETTPEESVPEESTPEETTPTETTPEENLPDTPTPEEPEQNETTPAETVPTETSPEESTPEETTPVEDDGTVEDEHVCEEVTGWKAFWNSIINFFRKLFGQPEICTCGEIIEKKK